MKDIPSMTQFDVRRQRLTKLGYEPEEVDRILEVL